MNTTRTTVSVDALDQLPYEVKQLCDLLARIYVRCLQEQNPEVIARLSETINTYQEGQHAAA